MHVGVAQAVFRQLVQHRCLDQAAEGRSLAVADIVKNKEDDVRCTFRGAVSRPAPGIAVAGLDTAQLVDDPEVVFQCFCCIVKKEHLVKGSHGSALGAGSVVRDNNDKRVVQLADLPEEIKDAPEMEIGEGNKPGDRPPSSGYRAAFRPLTTCPRQARRDRAVTVQFPGG